MPKFIYTTIATNIFLFLILGSILWFLPPNTFTELIFSFVFLLTCSVSMANFAFIRDRKLVQTYSSEETTSIVDAKTYFRGKFKKAFILGLILTMLLMVKIFLLN